MKYFLYLCIERSTQLSTKNRGGESPPDPKYRGENKCLTRHTVNLQSVLNLNYCKNILNKEENKYSEEEVRTIRDFLYFIAEIENNDLNEENDECDNLL